MSVSFLNGMRESTSGHHHLSPIVHFAIGTPSLWGMAILMTPLGVLEGVKVCMMNRTSWSSAVA